MFDKEKRGKLTEAELREIMLQMGDSPISEDEFENFIAVIIIFFTIKQLKNLFLSTLFQCFPVDSEGLHDYKGHISYLYHNNNNSINMKDSVLECANDAEDGT